MIELTEQQRRELGKPEPEAIDPQTQETYVLVRKTIYVRLRELLNEDVRATGELVDKIMAQDDAHDPYLSSYQSIGRETQA